ncbi:MAG: glycosyltransferase family 39 protein [Candidatus Methanoperedens sp.]|nr:glycosyltransferase family 39 protein [Candidatus Methanoperedens sp.]MCZ7394950.1 glycosyltransferase family 39 protein [Candidatus Methanoperedens sp.]
MAEKNIATWTFGEPPLYYLVLHFTLAIGKSETIIRFPSVIFGILSVFMIYKIGTLLYNKKEGLVSAFLLAISPTSIIFSQDAKNYSLFIFLSMATIYFFLKMEEKPTNGNKILFLISLILSFYNHYFTVILLAAIIIFKIWKSHKNIKDLFNFFLLIGIFLLFIIPILQQFISQVTIRSGSSYINFVYQTHLTNQFMREIFTFLIMHEFVGDNNIIYYLYLGLLLYGTLSSFDFLRFSRNSDTFTLHEKNIIFLVIWLFIPIAFSAILTNIISNLYIRYISFTLPAFLLISSHGIVTIPNGIISIINRVRKKVDLTKFYLLIVILIIIVVVLSTYPILNHWYKSENYDWKGASKFLEKNAEKNSNIILIPGYNSGPFKFYYKSNDTNVIEYSPTYDLKRLLYQNYTYIVVTDDVNALGPSEVFKITQFISEDMEIDNEFSGGISIYRNRTSFV